MLTMLVIINSLLLLLKHPLTIGLALLAQTLIIAMTTNLIMGHAWFSYVLVLVFLGGLLILFIYVATLASNEQLNMKVSLKSLALLTAMSFTLIILSSLKPILSSDSMIAEPMMTLFMTSFSFTSLFILCYLFIVLVSVVKITKFWSGSLRPLN